MKIRMEGAHEHATVAAWLASRRRCRGSPGLSHIGLKGDHFRRVPAIFQVELGAVADLDPVEQTRRPYGRGHGENGPVPWRAPIMLQGQPSTSPINRNNPADAEAAGRKIGDGDGLGLSIMAGQLTRAEMRRHCLRRPLHELFVPAARADAQKSQQKPALGQPPLRARLRGNRARRHRQRRHLLICGPDTCEAHPKPGCCNRLPPDDLPSGQPIGLDPLGTRGPTPAPVRESK